MKDENFLSRWSKRKSAAKSAPAAAPDVAPAQAQTPSPASPIAAPTPESAPPPLPPVESLTPESDFTPFMKPEVDSGLKRQALKTLFQDPRFNVMDGLDVYIDDYSKPDPLPPGWLEKMNQVARLGEYREPEKEEAPKEAPGEAREPVQAVENPPDVQPLAAAPSPSAADTPDAVSPPSPVKESPGSV
jgi:hypothetical protein